MPMLRTCGFAGCETLTLGTFCIEHERLEEHAAPAVSPRPLPAPTPPPPPAPDVEHRPRPAA